MERNLPVLNFAYICPNREPAGLPIVMQIFFGKLKCESVERVFPYIYVNIKDRSAPVYANFICLSIFLAVYVIA